MTSHDAHAHHRHANRAGPADHQMVTDPVCGMKVDPDTSQHRAVYGGETYHFCSESCRTKFTAEPEKYLTPEAKP
ncbi:YHS domain-containing protein, partial [Klebsiella pneumoniae]